MEIRLLQKEEINRLGTELIVSEEYLGSDTLVIKQISSYLTKQVTQGTTEQSRLETGVNSGSYVTLEQTISGQFLYVAAEDSTLMGFGVLAADGYLPYLYCHPDYQRQGAGIQLYRTMAAKALELGLKRLYTEANITTRRFFKSRGFSIIKEWRTVEEGQPKINYLMEKYLEEPKQFVVATFYHFANLPDYQEMQPILKAFCDRYHLKGTILLAQEGINSTIVGSRQGIDALLDYLRSDQRFQGLEHKESYCQVLPFQKLRVRLKKEIVTLGVPGIDPNRQVGEYVEPKDWNALISDPDVVVIDTRNIYEVKFGTFDGAIDPQITTFGQFPDYVAKNLHPEQQQKVAMFCTGGIRCEKASAYLLAQGFKEVYHLKGGILKYIAEVPPEESLWEGECFVFDDRITL